jgi:ABC-type uncharacterized transport system involved in gliding motility auxiliary subunit
MQNNSKLLAVLTTLLALVIILLINFLVDRRGVMNARLDLTEDKVYTLSEGTLAILGALPDPGEAGEVVIRFYATKDDRVAPPGLKQYADKVENLLTEFVKRSGGKISLRRFDPSPFTDDEDDARADGIRALEMSQDESAYLGMAIQYLEQKEVLPFVSPADETRLEYEVARALAKVTSRESPVVGVMSTLQVAGAGMMMPPQMMQGAPQPWLIYRQLQIDHEVREIPPSAVEIDEDIDVLLMIHPGEVGEATQYAIDQFILRGGRVIAYLDPRSAVALSMMGQQNPMGMSSNAPMASTLGGLLDAWGVSFSKNEIVVDMTLRTNFGRGQSDITLVAPSGEFINREQIVSSNLSRIQMLATGSFALAPVEGLTKTTLLRSSGSSQKIDAASAEQASSGELSGFIPDGTEKALAVLIEGQFKTAFPGGPPAGAGGGEGEEEGEEGEEGAVPEGHLAESVGAGAVVLFGDADMLHEQIATLRDPLGMPFNDNYVLLLNLIEWAGGDQNLIAVRSRGDTSRPFTRMNELEEEIEAEFRDDLEKISRDLDETLEKISNIQGGQIEERDGALVLILTPEQREQLEQFNRQRDEFLEKENELRKEQRRRKTALRNTIVLSNVMIVPAVVILFGIGVSVLRRLRG